MSDPLRGLRSAVRRRRAARAGPLPVRLPGGMLELLREGPVPLVPDGAAVADAPSLRVAIVVPSFRHGSGGHSTLANLVRRLEAAGHECSLWLDDDEGRHAGEPEEAVDAAFRAWFGPLRARLRTNFASWPGADVAVATGWQTVPRVLRLGAVRGRAYLVQDHEPEFFATSAEREWAQDTYRRGLHCICASPWLADVVRTRYGASASHFDLGVDHSRYRPEVTVARREDLIVFYARGVTPRRAVPLGVLALCELHRRRPDVEIALFGEAREAAAPFPHRHLGVLSPDALAAVYREATVGMVLSMTNPSLIPTEMMACGLPCVDVASEAMVATFGADGPVSLAAFDPLALADALERLVSDPALRAERSAAGLALVEERTWERAGSQVEEGLRLALRTAGERQH